MQITVIGRGRVGGGLAQRWTGAGHDVTALGGQVVYRGSDGEGVDTIFAVLYSKVDAETVRPGTMLENGDGAVLLPLQPAR